MLCDVSSFKQDENIITASEKAPITDTLPYVASGPIPSKTKEYSARARER